LKVDFESLPHFQFQAEIPFTYCEKLAIFLKNLLHSCPKAKLHHNPREKTLSDLLQKLEVSPSSVSLEAICKIFHENNKQ